MKLSENRGSDCLAFSYRNTMKTWNQNNFLFPFANYSQGIFFDDTSRNWMKSFRFYKFLPLKSILLN